MENVGNVALVFQDINSLNEMRKWKIGLCHQYPLRPDVEWLDGRDGPDPGYGWDIQDFKAFWVRLNKQTLVDNAVSLITFQV